MCCNGDLAVTVPRRRSAAVVICTSIDPTVAASPQADYASP